MTRIKQTRANGGRSRRRPARGKTERSARDFVRGWDLNGPQEEHFFSLMASRRLIPADQLDMARRISLMRGLEAWDMSISRARALREQQRLLGGNGGNSLDGRDVLSFLCRILVPVMAEETQAYGENVAESAPMQHLEINHPGVEPGLAATASKKQANRGIKRKRGRKRKNESRFFADTDVEHPKNENKEDAAPAEKQSGDQDDGGDETIQTVPPEASEKPVIAPVAKQTTREIIEGKNRRKRLSKKEKRRLEAFRATQQSRVPVLYDAATWYRDHEIPVTLPHITEAKEDYQDSGLGSPEPPSAAGDDDNDDEDGQDSTSGAASAQVLSNNHQSTPPSPPESPNQLPHRGLIEEARSREESLGVKQKAPLEESTGEQGLLPVTPRKRQRLSTSHFFATTTRPSPPKTPRPSRGTVSGLPFPPLTADSFGLVQERLAHDDFKLLIAVTFLIRTHGKSAIPTFDVLMAKYPTPQSLAEADPAEIEEVIHHLGLSVVRTSHIQRYARRWLEKPPSRDVRYGVKNYPRKGDGADVRGGEELPSEELDPRRSAWEIGYLTQGPYAIDSWRIFCRDRLLGRALDWKGGGREPEFQPEWMRVLPLDKELRAYLRWMWMREGWEWDPVTGDREVLSERMRRAVDGGRVEWDHTGSLRIRDELDGDVESS